MSFNSATFCFSYILTLFIRHFHPEAVEHCERYVMISMFYLIGNTSDYASRNWGNVGSYAVNPIAECLQRPENIQSKGNCFFVFRGGEGFVKFHVYGIVYKMHIKGIFLSIPVILEKFMPRS